MTVVTEPNFDGKDIPPASGISSNAYEQQLRYLEHCLDEQELVSATSSLLVQSTPCFDDEESFDRYCQQEDNIELAAMKWIEVTSKQSKELFSRLKFHALELQTKLLFLTCLYEADTLSDSFITPSQVLMTETNASLSKESLRSLKRELAQNRAILSKLIQDQVNDVHELEVYVTRHRLQLQELNEFHTQLKQQEIEYLTKRRAILEMQNLPADHPIDAPLCLFTLDEGKTMLEYQKLQIQDLKSKTSQQDLNLKEIKERHVHEDSLLNEYKAQLEEASRMLIYRKEEALQRDRQLEHMYNWYSEMTGFMQHVLGCRITLESSAPYRLIVSYGHHNGGRVYFITLDDRSGLATKIEPGSPTHDALIQKSRQLQSLSYLIHALKVQAMPQ